MNVNGKSGLKKPQPTHNCYRCLHTLSERAMVNVPAGKGEYYDNTFWECKNRKACDKRKADLTKLHQKTAWVTYYDNGGEVSEEVKAWETETPGLVAWKHGDMWELIHEPSGNFVEFAGKREDINGMAVALKDVTDWTQSRDIVATKDVLERTGMAIRQYWREHYDGGTYTGVR